MEFGDAFRVDMGFGGTKRHFEHTHSHQGETFLYLDNGCFNKIVIWSKENQITFYRGLPHTSLVEAHYSKKGELQEAGIWLHGFYQKYAYLESLMVEPGVKGEIDLLTKSGTSDLFYLVDFERSVFGLTSGNYAVDPARYFSALDPYVFEDINGIETLKGIDEDDEGIEEGEDFDFEIEPQDPGVNESYPEEPELEAMVPIEITKNSNRVNFTAYLNEDDMLIQSFARRLAIEKLLKKDPSPEYIKRLMFNTMPPALHPY